MAVVIYIATHDANHYLGFDDNRFGYLSRRYRDILNGLSLIDIWKPGMVSVTEGEEGDFVGGPTPFMSIAVSAKLLSPIASFVGPSCEFLRFTYQRKPYYGLYLPVPIDCLDASATEYHTDDHQPNNISKVAFQPSRLPKGQALFRIPGDFTYYATAEFKEFVEDHCWTGLSFRFAWCDGETSLPALAESKASPGRTGRRTLQTGRLTKRDKMLRRLWQNINSFGREEGFNGLVQTMTDAVREDNPHADAPQVLQDLLKHGISRQKLRRLCRSVAYHAVFGALVAIEEEGLDRSIALRGLHEDLLRSETLDTGCEFADL